MSPPDRAEEFVFLLARHERLLGAYVMTMVPHPQDADDILQEAKVVMWRNFGKFELGTNFGAWARKVAFHQVLAYRKRKHRDRLDFSEDSCAPSPRRSSRAPTGWSSASGCCTIAWPSSLRTIATPCNCATRKAFRLKTWPRASSEPSAPFTASSAACGMSCTSA